MPSAIRVRDLTDAADARPFTAPDQIAPGSLPLPCRAARLDASAWPKGAEAALTGVVTRRSRRGVILAGPAAALADAAGELPAPTGTRLAAALACYDAPAGALRFPGGLLWDMAARSRVLGILNVTPDSFSDGGRFARTDDAVRRAATMIEQGADGVDVGGESTRPGAEPVDIDEELRRVLPVVTTLCRRFPDTVVSIDTRRAAVARPALEAGARMINDVSALADPGMAPLAAEAGCAVAVMHMRGSPKTMQVDTKYADLVGEVLDGLDASLRTAEASGVAGDRLLVDPGFGFGKSAAGNELLLRQLDAFRTLGKPILVGVSRKSFIGRRTGVTRPDARLAGSLAAAVAAVLAGASVVRAHDVGSTRRALAVADAIRSAGSAARDAELRP